MGGLIAQIIMKVVVSLGGSIVASPSINRNFILSYVDMVLRLKKEDISISTVVGGGKIARDYIEAARSFGASEEFCDEIGILATRMNASLILSALGEWAEKRIPVDVEKVEDDNVVMGGTLPGHTTDAVSAMLASKIKADLLINASNVDGIYDKDPRKFPEARMLRRVGSKELLGIIKGEHRAGITTILDIKAARIIIRDRIRTFVLNGRDLENMERAIKGKSFKGTEVVL